MKRALVFLFLAAIAILAGYLATRRSGPVEVPFAKASRETLVSLVATNGKVEPVLSGTARAERDGLIREVMVERGRTVKAGTVLASLESPEAQAEIVAAESRVAAVRADLATFERGGRAAELAEIDGSLARLRLDQQKALKDLEAAKRLVEKKAAPANEVVELDDRLRRYGLEIQSLDQKRRALVVETDRTAALARLKDAESAVELARRKLALNIVRAPIDGVVYNLAVKKGAYVHTGDLIAEIGKLEKLRVIVFVDEPEMGKVKAGQPVKLTWDGSTGREWKGFVDRVPSQIVALGTRQVGEVITIAENPDLDLLPGANVNAEIETQVVKSALTIPKEALRSENGGFGVFAIESGRLVWRGLKLGATNTTRAEVLDGLREGDSVALPTERALTSGLEVKAVYP